ncbi:hypothetical protein ACFQ7B_11220 [Streptomyces erythrochromogenes]|uniref:hypothetical protein n=1 Tax=Streptomyces erythrochromogenes TaxID=285574 RepID=UPI003691F78D
MSIRQKVKDRRGAAVAVAAVLTLALAGCGGGDDKAGAPQPTASQSDGKAPRQAASTTPPAPLTVIGTAAGPAGVVLEINSAVRDVDGYVTVSGQIKNTGSSTFSQIAALRGDEKTASPASVAGASYVDPVGKKRYFVVRDTEGRCACTTGLSVVKSGESVPFFAQFPAPPATSPEIVFSLPTFATTTLKLSE